MNAALNPQNPYGSYVVTASAGCGKTYQLSRRFLYLVGAGADPHSILTITFTTKAAAEMRERILQEAARLLHDPVAGEEYAKELGVFFRHAQSQADALGFIPSYPRTPQAVGEAILAATQLLRISTIDSVFMDWVRKFPWEASEDQGETPGFATGFDVLSAREEKRINYEAWRKTLLAAGDTAGWAKLTFLELRTRVQQLGQHDSFLWLMRTLQRLHDTQGMSVLPIPEPQPIVSDEDFWSEFGQALDALLHAAQKTQHRDLVQTAIAHRDFTSLQDGKILTAKMGFNKQTFGKKVQETEAYMHAEALLLSYVTGRRVRELNAAGQHLAQLFHQYGSEREREKYQRGFIEFADTGKGALRLFNAEEASGARFLIHQQIQHLLLDEFQDTSLLQWMIFHLISMEMLSGRGIEKKREGVWPTVFIVGDEKQSIYGFREADPTILNTAAEKLARQNAQKVPLNHSFRTCQSVLDYVNAVFIGRLENFIPHQTAERQGQPVVPNHGGVWVSSLFPEKDRQEEARFVARFIKNAVTGEKPFYVAAKGENGTRVFRSLRLSDCVLLYRYSTHADVYEEALREAGLECQRFDGKGYFSRPEVADLHALVRFLAFPQDHLALAQILRSPLGRVDDKTLNEWLLQTASATGIERTKNILSILSSSHATLGKALHTCMVERDSMLPFPLLVMALQRLGAFAAYQEAWPGQEGVLAAANVQKFLELCADAQKAGVGHWPHLLQYLDEAATAEQVGNAAVGADAVTLMTIHKSKGLEFPCVVLVDAANKMDKTDVYWAKTGHGLYYVGTKDDQPENYAPFDDVFHEIKTNIAQENERLLYVALTRASQYLLVTGQGKDTSQGFWELVQHGVERLGAEAQPCMGWTAWQYGAQQEHVVLADAVIQEAKQEPYVIHAWEEDERGTQEEIYTLAPHRLLTRGDGGVISAYRAAYASSYGTLVHRALEWAVQGREFDTTAVWQELISDPHEALAEEAFAAAQKEIAAVLCDTAWLKLWQDASCVEVELPIVHLVDGVLVRGSLDLCVFRADGCIDIIDYKTTEETPATDLESAWPLLCQKHGYDQQLRMYKDAVSAMHPEATIRAGVYFTAGRKMVWLE